MHQHALCVVRPRFVVARATNVWNVANRLGVHKVEIGEYWMGIVQVETRMTGHVQVSGRNHLLEWAADGMVCHSCPPKVGETMDREFGLFNCDLRPDQG